MSSLREEGVRHAGDPDEGETDKANGEGDLRQLVDSGVLPTWQDGLKEEDEWGQAACDQEELEALAKTDPTGRVVILVRHEGLRTMGWRAVRQASGLVSGR
jgi:hypothetical protein